MRRMITDKLTKNIKEVVKAYEDGEIALTEDIVEVVANPTLAGDEAELTGLQVGDTKYAMPQGGGGGGNQLYQHSILIRSKNTSTASDLCYCTLTIISNSSTQINTLALLDNYLYSNNFIGDDVSGITNILSATGVWYENGYKYDIHGMTSDGSGNVIIMSTIVDNSMIDYNTVNLSNTSPFQTTITDKVITL